MRRSSDSWCDYVVVSDSLEGLVLAVIRRPKPEPRDTADIPPSNPHDPIDLELSPERLVRKKTEKRKQTDAEVVGQPAKKVQRKKITRRGNLDAFISKYVPEKPVSPVPTEPSAVVNEELPSSPPRASFAEQLKNTEIPEAGETAGAENLKADMPADVVDGAGNPQTPEPASHGLEKGKTVEDIHVITSPSKASGFMPENIEKVLVEGQAHFLMLARIPQSAQMKLWGTIITEVIRKKDASEIHRVCRDWLQGIFPPGEVKFQEGRLHDQTYHAYLEEVASYTSTTHHIVHEWHSMHKEWSAFKVSKKKVADDESCRTAEAEAAFLSEERKNWKKICEKDNAEKMGLHNAINKIKVVVEKLKKQDAEIERLKKEKADDEVAQDEAHSHRERSEQREKDLELAHAEKTEASRRLAETEEKLENSETARVTAESELEPLKSDIIWLKEHGIACVVESVLNSEEVDKTVARLVVAARNDGYAQGYAECSNHVVSALRVDWDTSRSATHGVNTDAAVAAMKTEFNNLQLHVMDLIYVALQSEDHVKEIFPDEENEDEALAYVSSYNCINNCVLTFLGCVSLFR
ncbi:hypothetical protein Hanom_Chr11g01006901 [Helianthus anomalus]